MPKPSDMHGKTVLITGAAAGLGRATALTLARAGANLSLIDIDSDGLQKTTVDAEVLGVAVLTQSLDLSNTDNCAAAVDATIQRFAHLDGLCNVAAVMIPSHTTEMSDADWDKTIAVNLSAPFKLIRSAIPHLLDRHGAIVNVTSCAAFQGQAYLAAYSATKAALTHMTKSLAMEYIHTPLRINAVAPGGMLTALAAGLRNLKDPDISLLSRYSPLRGLVEIDDVAEMVAYLVSDAGRSYHGACINIDSGITAG